MARANAIAPAEHLAHVFELPTAANDPVVNRRVRGRYPSNVIPLWRLRQLRYARLMEEQQQRAARIQPGMLVKIAHRESKNFGRVCRMLAVTADGDWRVEALSGELMLKSGRLCASADVPPQWLQPL